MRPRPFLLLIAGVALALMAFLVGCLDEEQTETEEVEVGDNEENEGETEGITRSWWCSSSGMGGHHVDPAYEGMTKGNLSDEDCQTVNEQFAAAIAWAMQWPTIGEAEDDEFHMVVDYVEGMGTHHARIGNFSMDDDFDPDAPEFPGTRMDEVFEYDRPEFLMYSGTDPDSSLVGFAWYVKTDSTTPPEGFAGDNDWWHRHNSLCFTNATFRVTGQDLSDEECESSTSTNVRLHDYWMVHAWIIEPWLQQHDVYANHHPCLSREGPITDSGDACWMEAMHGSGHDSGNHETGPECHPQTFTIHPDGGPLLAANGDLLLGWDPGVIYYDGLYRVWYTLYDGPTQTLGIAYAESPDGVNWTRHDGHVMVPTEGGWDSRGLETVSVIEKDGEFWMWYMAYPCNLADGENGREKCIGLAKSLDGVNWTKHPEPVLEPELWFEGPYSYEEDGETWWDGGLQEPSVIWDMEAGLFRMWYTGTRDYPEAERNWTVKTSRVGYATSPDGINWTKNPEPVLVWDSNVSWENWNFVVHTNVVADPVLGYHLFYSGGSYSIGHAWSADGVNWTRDADSPLLWGYEDEEGVVMYGGPSAIFEADGSISLFHMRSVPGAQDWGDGGMVLGLAIGSCEA